MPRDPSINEAFQLPGRHPGMVGIGNINLGTRPLVHNRDGSVSTVRSTSFNIDGHEVLLPTVIGNHVVPPHQALLAYLASGRNLGSFTTPAAANKYASLLHQMQAQYYGLTSPKGP